MGQSTLVKLFVVLLLAAVSGGAIGWWTARKIAPPVDANAIAASAPSAKSTNAPASAQSTPGKTNSAGKPSPGAASTNNSAATGFTAENWQAALEQLSQDAKLNNAEKSRKIAAAIPTLPELAQVELVKHLAALTPDENYDIAAEILLRFKTPKPAMQVLMDDLLNRDTKIRLPLLLNIVRLTEHPLQISARQSLSAALGSDFGSDWKAWENAIREHNKAVN